MAEGKHISERLEEAMADANLRTDGAYHAKASGDYGEYSISTSSSKITLFITQDWYIKPEFSTSYGENANGLLYYNYRYNNPPVYTSRWTN